jgi:hypothetical protein
MDETHPIPVDKQAAIVTGSELKENRLAKCQPVAGSVNIRGEYLGRTRSPREQEIIDSI